MTQRETELSVLCQAERVLLCYAFGSHAQDARSWLDGNDVSVADPLTDLDIGVVFEVLPPLSVRRRVYADLANGLSSIFPFLSVDLTFTQEGHSVFQSKAILGYCLYQRTNEERFQYEERVLQRSADFAWVLETYHQERLADLQGGCGDD